MDPAQSPISCISFDQEEELTFVGHHSGRIVSYASPSLEKFSAFVAHDAPVLDIVGVGSSILSLSHTGLRCHKKVFFLNFFFFLFFFNFNSTSLTREDYNNLTIGPFLAFFSFFPFSFFLFPFSFFLFPFSFFPFPFPFPLSLSFSFLTNNPTVLNLFAMTVFYACAPFLLLLGVTPILYLSVEKCHLCSSLI